MAVISHIQTGLCNTVRRKCISDITDFSWIKSSDAQAATSAGDDEGKVAMLGNSESTNFNSHEYDAAVNLLVSVGLGDRADQVDGELGVTFHDLRREFAKRFLASGNSGQRQSDVFNACGSALITVQELELRSHQSQLDMVEHIKAFRRNTTSHDCLTPSLLWCLDQEDNQFPELDTLMYKCILKCLMKCLKSFEEEEEVHISWAAAEKNRSDAGCPNDAELQMEAHAKEQERMYRLRCSRARSCVVSELASELLIQEKSVMSDIHF
eukprot:COSAG05_NODE_404_length_10192_cov_3.830377_1_plen_266_part_10